MSNSIRRPIHFRSSTFAAGAKLGFGLILLLLLNGCAALAVSLAGAGASAGLSHQMNGTATRTFSEPFDKVDAATRIASKRMFLVVDQVASSGRIQVTTARVSNLNIELEMETLSPNMTRITVTARKDLFRVDGATAQEVVAQIERALGVIEQSEAAELARAQKDGKVDDASFVRGEPAGSRKSGNANRKKTSI